MSEKAQTYGQRYVDLMKVLSRCSTLERYDQPGEPQAATVAHAFLDLEESFRRFVEMHLVALTQNDLSEEEVCEKLQDIGEEFRHILYHIRDMQFYRDVSVG
jgi:hypothetical protein